jgi:ketosteroid isomerase-like protein
MGSIENKHTAQAGYEAFEKGDAEAAMRDLDDSIEWTVRGHNALTGTYKGKQQVGDLWGRIVSHGFHTEPHDFISDGDKVVVLTTVHIDGESTESADVLTYNAEGKCVSFDTLGDESVLDRAFPA